MSEGFWGKIDEILDVLRPIYNATVEMQTVGYGLADFCVSWLRIGKNLDRVNHNETITNLAYELST